MSEATSPTLFLPWRSIAMAAWPQAPMSWATADIDAPRLLEHIDQVRHATGPRITPTQLASRAPVHTSDPEGAKR
jgi:hypothetical protein